MELAVASTGPAHRGGVFGFTVGQTRLRPHKVERWPETADGNAIWFENTASPRGAGRWRRGRWAGNPFPCEGGQRRGVFVFLYRCIFSQTKHATLLKNSGAV